jgi:hypothetical protein
MTHYPLCLVIIEEYRHLSHDMSQPVSKMAIIKAGQIFVLTSGDYSNYGLDGIFRALKDIDPEDKHQWPDELETAANLVQAGFAEELTFTEWHRD